MRINWRAKYHSRIIQNKPQSLCFDLFRYFWKRLSPLMHRCLYFKQFEHLCRRSTQRSHSVNTNFERNARNHHWDHRRRLRMRHLRFYCGCAFRNFFKQLSTQQSRRSLADCRVFLRPNCASYCRSSRQSFWLRTNAT